MKTMKTTLLALVATLCMASHAAAQPTATQLKNKALQHRSSIADLERQVEVKQKEADLAEQTARKQAATIEVERLQLELQAARRDAEEAQVKAMQPESLTRAEVETLMQQMRSDFQMQTEAAIQNVQAQRQAAAGNGEHALSLVGVMSDGRAMLRGSSTGKAHTAREGQIVMGYQIIKVSGDSVVLSRDGQSSTIYLGQ